MPDASLDACCNLAYDRPSSTIDLGEPILRRAGKRLHAGPAAKAESIHEPSAVMQGSFRAGWAAIDETSDPASYVRFMDTVRKGNDGDPQQYRELFDLLAPQAGASILDVSCGTGGAVRALAGQVGSSGHVMGVDYSVAMITEAKKRARGLDLPVAFRMADAQALPFDDDRFDGCFSVGTFEILPDPYRALAEMARVTRPGGRLVVLHAPDADGFVIDASDRAVTRRLLHFIADHEWNGWIGRQLPSYARDLGLSEIQIVPRPWIVTDFALVYDRQLSFRQHLARAQAAGVLTAEEAAAWVSDQEARQQAGRSFLCLPRFTLSARKP